MKVWEDGRFVETLPEGKYFHPLTGSQYYLSANMGWHSGPGYAVTGWPLFWRELEPDLNESIE